MPNQFANAGRLLLVVLVLSLVPTGSVKSWPWNNDEFTLWFRADVTIGADGRVTALEWRNYKPMPTAALRSLERVVPTWQFRPSVADATWQEVGTTLTIQVLARERDDKTFGLQVAQAFTGPSLLDQRNDRGWQRWERWDRGRVIANFEAVFDVEWQDGGAHAIDLVELRATKTDAVYRDAHRARFREQIAGWQIRLETVDGRPVAARFRYLYAHCVITAGCGDNDFRSLRALPEVPRGDPVPLESVVTLESDVRGLTL